jgi:hypothetical protein
MAAISAASLIIASSNVVRPAVSRIRTSYGRRPVDVQRGHQHLPALQLREPQGQLGRHGRLAGALKAGQQQHRRRIGGHVQRRGLALAAQHLDQAVVDDLDHLVGGLDRADHRLAGGLHAGLVDEVPHHRQGDVGFQQGHAHLAHGRVDVLLGQHAAAGEPVEDAREAFG